MSSLCFLCQVVAAEPTTHVQLLSAKNSMDEIPKTVAEEDMSDTKETREHNRQ